MTAAANQVMLMSRVKCPNEIQAPQIFLGLSDLAFAVFASALQAWCAPYNFHLLRLNFKIMFLTFFNGAEYLLRS